MKKLPRRVKIPLYIFGGLFACFFILAVVSVIVYPSKSDIPKEAAQELVKKAAKVKPRPVGKRAIHQETASDKMDDKIEAYYANRDPLQAINKPDVRLKKTDSGWAAAKVIRNGVAEIRISRDPFNGKGFTSDDATNISTEAKVKCEQVWISYKIYKLWTKTRPDIKKIHFSFYTCKDHQLWVSFWVNKDDLPLGWEKDNDWRSFIPYCKAVKIYPIKSLPDLNEM